MSRIKEARRAHRDGIDPPRDYAEPFAFVPSHNAPLTLGERLVLFFRLSEALTFWFAVFAIALFVGAVIGAYVELGR